MLSWLRRRRDVTRLPTEEADLSLQVDRQGMHLQVGPAALQHAHPIVAGDPHGAFVEVGWTSAAPPTSDALEGQPAPTSLQVHTDPYGVRQVFWTVDDGRLLLSTRLRVLLAQLGRRPSPHLPALRRYLTFGFMPEADTGLQGIHRLPAGHRLRWDGQVHLERWHEVREQLDPALSDPEEAARAVLAAGRAAVERLPHPAALYLSGGLDSSAVAAWCPRRPTAFTLDLGRETEDRLAAEAVARHLGLRLEVVPATPAPDDVLAVTRALDLPVGDPVTVPQLLLGRAARGLGVALNGEGGDQLFGGWTNKPMLSAALYTDEPLEHEYLRSWHRFWGEPILDLPDSSPAVLTPTLRRPDTTLLGRLRLTDLATKGSCSILPRAWQIARAQGLDLHMPLVHPALVDLAFRLPPDLKLRGAEEKHVLKRALRGLLPDPIIDRRKAGMGVPANAWLGGPLRDLMEDVLSDAAVRRRGLLDPQRVAALRRGEHAPGETRSRRLGERLWTVLALELWLRDVVDG